MKSEQLALRAICLVLLVACTAKIMCSEITDPPVTCTGFAMVTSDASDPDFSGLTMHAHVDCGTSDGRVRFELITPELRIESGGRVYGSFGAYQTFDSPTSTASADIDATQVGCLAPGEYTYGVNVHVFYYAPSFPGPEGGVYYPLIDNSFPILPSQSLTISAENFASSVSAKLLDPPQKDGNVRIAYHFGEGVGAPGIAIDRNGSPAFELTRYTDERVVNLAPGHHIVYADGCGYDDILASTTIDVPKPPSGPPTPPPSDSIDYSLVGAIRDGTASDTEHLGTSTVTYAQVPLGLELSLTLLNKGLPVSAKYTLGAATIKSLAAKTLYPNNAVLEYDRTATSVSKIFRAVHLGTQTLTINPATASSPALKPVQVTIGVFDPGELGDDLNAYDVAFVNFGHARGIPPQVIKGLVKQEGTFNPFEWRYEPISPTTGDRYIQNVLSQEPYVHYVMATATDPQGDSLLDLNAGLAKYATDDDVSPRKNYHLPRGAASAVIPIRPIDVCPPLCVTAREILKTTMIARTGAARNTRLRTGGIPLAYSSWTSLRRRQPRPVTA
jgi:hypothetical protein